MLHSGKMLDVLEMLNVRDLESGGPWMSPLKSLPAKLVSLLKPATAGWDAHPQTTI